MIMAHFGHKAVVAAESEAPAAASVAWMIGPHFLRYAMKKPWLLVSPARAYALLKRATKTRITVCAGKVFKELHQRAGPAVAAPREGPQACTRNVITLGALDETARGSSGEKGRAASRQTSHAA